MCTSFDRSRSFALSMTAAASLFAVSIANACPSHSADSSSIMEDALVESILSGTSLQSRSSGASLAPITTWKLNYTGARGTSTNAQINSYVSNSLADVQAVKYDNTYAYVTLTDIPSHSVGPFPGNPAYPAVVNRTVRIPRTPSEATTHATTGMGPIGVMSNGVFIFNASDARTYNNAGVWQQNANVVEAASFDGGPGHPAPGMGGGGGGGTLVAGTYHYHQSPSALIAQVDAGNTGQHHSPLIGYAFDGFPIYGPYGYTDPGDTSSAIKRLSSSYKLRDDVLAGSRNTLVDGGTTLPTNQRGPAVNSTYPAGYYLQDYEYAAGVGDLNQYNMRFTKTPEYPDGTWAYFVTYDAQGKAAYPYIVGPQYFGVVDTANNQGVTVPAGAFSLHAGDANVDGSVNFDDLLSLAQHYGKGGEVTWLQGDFDRTNSVDFSDLLLLAQNYSSASFEADWALAQSIAPEPTAALLPAILAGGRRRRDA